MNNKFNAPLLMVDVVLLTLFDSALHVGLIRRTNANEPFHGTWSLPGGFIHPQADVDALASAKRILATKASVQSPYLEQLSCFAGVGRDPRGWSASIAYYALVPSHVAPDSHDGFRWAVVDEVLTQTLPFDHNAILLSAVQRVRSKTSYSSLPIHLMPQEFTLSEFRAVYEQLLGGSLEPRGFVRRIQELDILEVTEKTKSEGYRPARVYKARPATNLVQLSSALMSR